MTENNPQKKYFDPQKYANLESSDSSLDSKDIANAKNDAETSDITEKNNENNQSINSAAPFIDTTIPSTSSTINTTSKTKRYFSPETASTARVSADDIYTNENIASSEKSAMFNLQDDYLVSLFTPSTVTRFATIAICLFIGGLGINILGNLFTLINSVWNGRFNFSSLVSLCFNGGLLVIVAALFNYFITEYRSLQKLKRHEQERIQAGEILSDVAKVSLSEKQKAAISHHHGTIFLYDHAQAVAWCQKQISNLQLDAKHPAVVNWKNSLNSYQTPAQVLQLFSQHVLEPFDQQVLDLIYKRAAADALVVAVSNNSLIEMGFIAWRSVRLVNQISNLYGMKLGYVAKVRLFKYIMLNVALTGVSESIEQWLDVTSWVGSSIFGRFSQRVGQGLGIGFLSLRLGVKALELTRPLPFTLNNRPKITLLGKEVAKLLANKVKDLVVKDKQES